MSAGAIRGGKVFVEIGADAKKFFAAINLITKKIGAVGQSLQNVGAKMTAIGAAISAPVVLATRQFAVFDDAIRATAAVSGAAGAELQMLNDTARMLGATTSFTAVQVANLMTELGRAGFKPDEINAMTGAVLNLSRATGTEAALSAGIMAATLRQFGLGATEAARAADVLTKAANSTFNTVEGLGESLKYAGPVASSLGMSLEDTVAILGVLGNVGIQGSEAGTALRRLSVISAATGEDLKRLFGITNIDAAGNLKPLVQILDEINTATANMPVAERTKKMADAFGLLGITSANVLSQSADGVRGLAESLRGAEGTAAKTAKEMDAGLGGAIRIMLSAVEGTALALGDALAPSLMRVAKIVEDVSGGLTAFIKNNQELIVSIAKGIAIFTAAGAALIAMGLALKLVGVGLAFALSPMGSIVAIAAAMTVSMGGFGTAMADLSNIASTTFSGIYAAIADGDLSGAMDVLWAGLYAGWLRGVEALMGAVDPWVSMFQNTFTAMGTEIAIIWDGIYNGGVIVWNNIAAVIMGVTDNLVNGVMAAFDKMVAAVRKSWNWVQSFIKRGYDLAAENDKVDSEMDARRRQREAERPGIDGRQRQADRKNSEATRESMRREKAMRENADETMQRREEENRRRADQRRADTQAAEGNVSTMTRGKREKRVQNQQFADLLKNVEGATTLDQLRSLYEEFDALSSNGRLTSAQIATLETAIEDAQERVSRATSSMGGQSPSDRARGGAGAAAAAAGASEVVGTFSASGLGGMGFGASLAQKQLDVMKQIEQNTRVDDAGLVGD